MFIELIKRCDLHDYLNFHGIQCVLWHEWKRGGALYGSLTHDAVLAFLIQICILVQHIDSDAYCPTKVLLSASSKTD